MNLGLPEKFGFENRGLAAPEWNHIGSSSSCNWNQPSDEQNLSFSNGRPVPLTWNAPDSAEKREAFFVSDTGFIGRAAGISCFVSNELNAAAEAQMQMNGAGKIEAFPLMDQREDWEESPVAKKRKRSSVDQEMELNQIQAAAKDASNSKKKAGRTSSKMAALKPSGKISREVEEDGKEDYIHVRARRGQATNSHSLAERVRREKISERMKFLQDLVPGCSKVTGKAVMLDEIIKYVQSLQQQVEFLSMKLAAGNPRLEFSLEGLLSKELFQSRGCSSPAVEFSPESIHRQLHSLHRGLIQIGLPFLVSDSCFMTAAMPRSFPECARRKSRVFIPAST